MLSLSQGGEFTSILLYLCHREERELTSDLISVTKEGGGGGLTSYPISVTKEGSELISYLISVTKEGRELTLYLISFTGRGVNQRLTLSLSQRGESTDIVLCHREGREPVSCIISVTGRAGN